MSYLRGGCGVNRTDGESNKNVYGGLCLSSRGNNPLWCGGGGEVQHTEIVWISGKSE